MPRQLTETAIRGLQPAAPGKRYAVSDALVPGLKVRVSASGSKSFILWRRYDGAANATARVLGTVGAMTLAEARAKAREWLYAIKRGEDPRAARPRQAAAANRTNTFAAVLDDYLTRHVHGQRKAAVVAREMRNDLLPRWRTKPLNAITRTDVVGVIDAIKDRGSLYQAHNVFGHIRTFFNWAIERGTYGVDTSPCDRIKPERLIGKKQPRQRVLTDEELFAFWRAASRLGYPNGTLLQMLLLTGQRKNECAAAHWREFNIGQKTWTIPPERFKSAASHTVPLTDDVLALLRTLPRFVGGDFLFTSTGGRQPVNSFGRVKNELDRRMLRTLKALALRRGERAVTLRPFVVHDLRRSVRTRLSALRVPDAVAEMVIGHGRKGIQRVYDQHQYLEEMRAALTAWNALLHTIVAGGDQ
jgi:integrase